MEIRGGGWGPEMLRQTVYLRLAPHERPDAALALASPDGSEPAYIAARLVDDANVSVDGRTFFGFGVGGMVAAGLASAVDRIFAPWDLQLWFTDGVWLDLHAYRGPAPGQGLLADLEQRLRASRVGPALDDDEDDDFDEDEDDDEYEETPRSVYWELEGSLADKIEAAIDKTWLTGGDPRVALGYALTGSWARQSVRRVKGDKELREQVRAVYLGASLAFGPVDQARQRWIARLLDVRHPKNPSYPSYSHLPWIDEAWAGPLPPGLRRPGAVARDVVTAVRRGQHPRLPGGDPGVQLRIGDILHLAAARNEDDDERERIEELAHALVRAGTRAGGRYTARQTAAVAAAARMPQFLARRGYGVDAGAAIVAASGLDIDVCIMACQLREAGARALGEPEDAVATLAGNVLSDLGYDRTTWVDSEPDTPSGW
ncbi:hypothetical protein Cch01nite_20250 [Cellulomonas chitinilytica]|uniref:Uncharacterized protein n=2 Tax=Cellulomonas chitinilytica TaxID=398759 RepID=A0A919P474_9CELL|nr:hypothetical protein Cch01nite_20250 [Cellulomonas chitinilytica]